MIAYIAAYKDHAEANIVFTSLLERGLTYERLGLLFGENIKHIPEGFSPLTTQDPDGDLAEKTAGGAMIGGVAGMALGVLTVAIPGVGIVLALGAVAGTIAGALLGASVGGVVGQLTRTEPIHADIELIYDVLKQDGVAIIVHATETERPAIEATFADPKPDAFTVRHLEPGEHINLAQEAEVLLSKPHASRHNPQTTTAAGDAASDMTHHGKSPIQRKRERDNVITHHFFDKS